MDESDKVDKPKFTQDYIRGIIANFKGSMNVAPAEENPEGLMAYTLEANLRVSVEGYKSNMNNEDNLVEEAFWNPFVPNNMVLDPVICLIFQELDTCISAPDF